MAKQLRTSQSPKRTKIRGGGSNNNTPTRRQGGSATPSPTRPTNKSRGTNNNTNINSNNNNNKRSSSSSSSGGVVVTFLFLMLVFVYQLSKVPIVLVSPNNGGSSTWSVMDASSSAGATHLSSSSTTENTENLLSPAEWNDMLKKRRQGMSSKPEDSLKIVSQQTTISRSQQAQAQAQLKLAAMRQQQQSQQQQATTTLLLPTDALYQKGTWDKSPIIIEKYKLMFFTVPKVGCTGFKQLFRRMMGYENWSDHQYYNEPFLPHNPSTNGLKYLSDYPFSQANEMLTSPEWTRAIFVRKPAERILSAYLDKAVYSQGYYLRMRCCNKFAPTTEQYNLLQCSTGIKHYQAPPPGQKETSKPIMSFEDFVTKIIPTCSDPHWEPQATRMAPKYWNQINFVGKFENLFDDTHRLLSSRLIGDDGSSAWDKFGARGWIVNGIDGAMFDPKQKAIHGTKARDSSSKAEYFTTKAMESIQQYYFGDYHHNVMQFGGGGDDHTSSGGGGSGSSNGGGGGGGGQSSQEATQDNQQQQASSSSPLPPPPSPQHQQQQEQEQPLPPQQRKPLVYKAGATVTRRTPQGITLTNEKL